MFDPFKDRTLNLEETVKIYRCLHRKGTVFSIQQNGKVIGHSSNISLQNVSFTVNPSGKRRAIQTGQRNVHAFVRGIICPFNNQTGRRISYDPFNSKGFYFVDDEKEVLNLAQVTFNSQGLWESF